MKKLFLVILMPLLLPGNFVRAQEKPGFNKEQFYPFSVWYSGGKERATMLAEVTPGSREEWKKDMTQIKSLGFNSVKTSSSNTQWIKKFSAA